MILIAGIYEPDIERVKALLTDHAFPAEQVVIDGAFAHGELSIPEWAKAISALAAEQEEPFGFGASACAGFFSGYLTLFPTAEIISVKSDILNAIADTDYEGHDRVGVARILFASQSAIDQVLEPVPHTALDMSKNLSDADILKALGQREQAA